MKQFSNVYLSISLVSLFLQFTPLSQTQIGADINGESSGDGAGTSVSMPNAYTVATGAFKNDGGGSNSGHVRVHEWDGSFWIQKGTDINGSAAFDEFGTSVSMPDQNYLAVGGPLHDGSLGIDQGETKLYRFNGTNWIQRGTTIAGETGGHRSGYSISMPDTNTVAIGSPNGNQVRIYRWDGADWIQKGIDINGSSPGDKFGYSVSMPDSNTVAIGATENDDIANNAGQVQIFNWDGVAWVQKGMNINGDAIDDFSGYAVSMPDPNTVAIGAIFNDDSGLDAGQTKIYAWDGSAWVQKGSDTNGEAAGDQFGCAVSMYDSNTLAIGGRGNDGTGSNSGHVRVFNWNGTIWEQNGTDINGEAIGDLSGWSVSMGSRGSVAIGAIDNDGGGAISGHTRIYCLTTYGTLTTEICEFETYTSPSGIYTYSTSGIYSDTIPNVLGCDSVISINLAIIPATYGSLTPSICEFETYTSPSGLYVYSTSGMYSDTLTNAMGCDSIISVNLTIIPATYGTLNPSICEFDTYTSPSGLYVYSTTGIYSDTLTNAMGCDSIITIDLEVKTVDVSTTYDFPTISANATGATFQWIYCDSIMISGETGNNFTPTENGEYAVIVTQNGCSDTSDCQSINSLGVENASFGNEFDVYPNPTSGMLNINLGSMYNAISVNVRSVSGQIIQSENFSSTDNIQLDIEGEAGLYLITIFSEEGEMKLLRIVKN